ncbi:hypothetical protein Y032_0466g1966 [Ancylostoma ceylanicum]|uniref:Uncharacterized protein n=1 Tax=Ancylostoma ceylanicum TaxID=53326 RepID=A0A016WYC2_9BILA|nr:hypothetical protein Y032_0466g1966 [Ancylostoma ceylanicum]
MARPSRGNKPRPQFKRADGAANALGAPIARIICLRTHTLTTLVCVFSICVLTRQTRYQSTQNRKLSTVAVRLREVILMKIEKCVPKLKLVQI